MTGSARALLTLRSPGIAASGTPFVRYEIPPTAARVTPEDRDLRHLLYGNKPHIYRVIYRVLEKQKQVDVLHIRHGARQEFKTDELM